MAEIKRQIRRSVARKAKPKRLKVVVLQRSIDEGHAELNDGEYWHCVKILRRLCRLNDRKQCSDLRITPIDGIFELREKGGLLHKKNMRFFFGML